VVANLSRRAQFAELPLQEFAGVTPVELFGQTAFPAIGELPYLLTMAPYGYYWFLLPKGHEESAEQHTCTPTLRFTEAWEEVFLPSGAARLAHVLPRYLRSMRWFAGKARKIQGVGIVDAVPLASRVGDKRTPRDWSHGALVLARVEYGEGEPETYLLPLRVTRHEEDGVDLTSVLARLHTGDGDFLLCDAVSHPEYGEALLDAMLRLRRPRGSRGQLLGSSSQWLRTQVHGGGRLPMPTVLGADQSNTSLLYGHRAILKILRRPMVGESPELEMGRFLTTKAHFPNAPQLVGSLEYAEPDAPPTTIAVLHRHVENEGSVWDLVLDTLRAYLASVAASPEGFPSAAHKGESLLTLATRTPPVRVADAIGGFLDRAHLLGRRTAELHLALASDADDPGFAPEPFSRLFQRSFYQSLRRVAMQSLRRARQTGMEGSVALVVDHEQEILERLRAVVQLRITADRIRVHGDYHLGQVLDTGRDFVIIDFEGEPGRPLAGRRLKRAALEDVAGMIRSFHYAAATAVSLEPDMADETMMRAWADTWYRWIAATFLRGYLDTCGDASFIPSDPKTRGVLLAVLLLGKATYELGYELDNRPAWVDTPARGILDLLATDPAS
ncbi:MAG TPA: putative maltokinase, partial [Thermoleophilia bacterium]|nr:putative maltokinase [Thermoleophilia bacterium]